MKKGTCIPEHLHRLDKLSDQLEAIGEHVSEVHKVAVLLRSVQETYSTLVTAFLARGDDDLTLVFVKQAPLDEEQRGRKGHFARNCPKSKCTKRHHHARKLRNRKTQNLTWKEEMKIIFVAKVGLKANIPSCEWIIDSRASHHMTSEKNIFNSTKSLKPLNLLGLVMVVM